jgi:transposase
VENTQAWKPVPTEAVRAGARAVMQHRTKQSSGLSAWLAQLMARTHQNIAIVALANKLARMAWAVLAKNEAYRPPLLAGTAI